MLVCECVRVYVLVCVLECACVYECISVYECVWDGVCWDSTYRSIWRIRDELSDWIESSALAQEGDAQGFREPISTVWLYFHNEVLMVDTKKQYKAIKII